MGKPAAVANTGTNTGSLLRLFQSEYFDVHLHMHYLLAMDSGGVQDYLVNALYKMGDDDVDLFLPQLCQVALMRYSKSSLHLFLRDKASRSMHFALKIGWLMQGEAEDRRPERREAALAIVENCEEALATSEVLEAPANGVEAGAALPPGHGHAGHGGHLQRERGSTAPWVPAALDLEDGVPHTPGAATTCAGSPAACASPQQSPSASRGLRMMRRTSSCPQLQLRDGDETAEPLPRLASTPKARSVGFSLLEDEDAADSGGSGGSGGSGQGEDDDVDAAPSDSLRGRCLASGSATPGLSRTKVLRRFTTLCRSLQPDQWAQARGLLTNLPNAYQELGNPLVDWMASAVDEGHVDGHMHERGQFMLKEVRRGFVATQRRLIDMITKLTLQLVATAERDERKVRLRSAVRLLNRWLLDRRVVGALAGEGQLALLGLHIPCLRGRDYKQQVLHVHADQCKVFSSATRAPFLLVYETANLEEAAGGTDATAALAATVVQELKAVNCLLSCPEEEGGFLGLSEQPLLGHLAMLTSEEWLATPAMDLVLASPILEDPASPATPAEPAAPAEPGSRPDSPAATAAAAAAEDRSPNRRQRECAPKVRQDIWGEPWAQRREAIQRSSPFGGYPSWGLNAIVVKGGDDLRQELLASQVIRQFSAIFKEARLPLWLKEMEVLVTSASSGCIEFLHNSMSVTGIKKMFPERALADIFQDAFADRLFQAKRNFIESYAAYSLVVWFLQVKDRHNDNVMMLESGHVVHLDFGFMLSNSPGGNMGFEQSPFKLTQEFLDVMGGAYSDEFEYFRTLMVRGFLEARKHMDRIILPVRMLLASGSKLPAFRDGQDWVLQTLQDRFFTSLTEEACIDKVLELIETSANNWSTIQYDMYQKYVNGIV